MTLPIIHLNGSPYEQGRQHGRSLRRQIVRNRDVYFDRFWREGGVDRDEVLRRAALYAPAIAAQNEAYDAGMRGIADGAGLPYLEVVALNVRYEILYYQYMVNQQAARDGCTAFALAPEGSANGHLLIGQNWDWIPDVEGALLHTVHDDGLRTLAFTEAGIFGGKIGLNTAGLGLVINGLVTTDDDWSRLSKPFHLRCYEILRQRSLDAAAAIISGEDRACSANYLLAQVPDRVVDVEAAPHSINRLSWQGGCLVHANHFVDPAALNIEEPRDELYRRTSCTRQERLQQLLQEEPPATIAAIQEYLRDHNTAPRHICRHEDKTAPIDEQYRTVTSVIIDLTARTMAASDGPPCENDYQRVALEEGG
ncbi:MAG TPA: C45 family peptidase [Candidatus Binatia bacterium]|nr:C45 family peptidase [Candidatus Binatia bacterium]